MSVVDGSEASIDKVDGDEKEAAASAIPNNNSEPDERKARMALMVAKLQDADHQSMVDYAEEVGSRLDNAITNKSEWEQTDDRGVPSEKKIRDVELRTATDEIEKAKKMHWEARGDYAETCPPSQATTSYEPVGAVGVSGGVEPDKAGPLPLTTGDIAFCFAGLRCKTEKEWKDLIGKGRNWVERCLIQPGTRGRGGAPKLWNPVCIGAALVRDGHAKPNSVRETLHKSQKFVPAASQI